MAVTPASAARAGLAGRRYLPAVLLLALLSTVPTLLLVAAGAVALSPARSSDEPPVGPPFVTYTPGSFTGRSVEPSPRSLPPGAADVTPVADASLPPRGVAC